MTNKTFIPAFKAYVGDWEYYICIMKYAEVSRQVSFAYELNMNKELGTMIQRGLTDRTETIKNYLINSEHRFLGALIVAVWDGAPNYIDISMDDPDGILSGIDRQFGVLTFDGTQQYFALDGQHRLRAIKDAIRQKPDIGKEDICVIMVPHFQSEEGKIRTRRLFTNINRNAKTTTNAENIILDEDDGAAIISRRLLTDHPFLSTDGVVKVISRQGEEGELKLAQGNVSQTDPRAFTTISNLYEIVRILSFDLPQSMRQPQARPSDDILDESYTIISQRLDDLILAAGNVRGELQSGISARELRAPKGRESEGSPFMRPIVQKAVSHVVAQIASQDVLAWPEITRRLSALNWRLGSAPWLAIFNPSNGRIISSKENVDLLKDLLYIHLAAPSKQSIKKARQKYKEIIRSNYPLSEEALQESLIPHNEISADIPEYIGNSMGESE
jgi:DNA sulfur modification protein DndB